MSYLIICIHASSTITVPYWTQWIPNDPCHINVIEYNFQSWHVHSLTYTFGHSSVPQKPPQRVPAELQISQWQRQFHIQYIPRNMHTVFALLCFVVVIHWLIFPYPSGLLHWHCGNLTISPVPAKQPWWIWINTSCEFIMNDCITTTKQSTTKPCAYFLGYIVPC